MISDYIETPFDDCDFEYLMKLQDDISLETFMEDIYRQIDDEIDALFWDELTDEYDRYYLEALEWEDFDDRVIKYIG